MHYNEIFLIVEEEQPNLVRSVKFGAAFTLLG